MQNKTILIPCALFCFLIGCMIHENDYDNIYRLSILTLLGLQIGLEYWSRCNNHYPTKTIKNNKIESLIQKYRTQRVTIESLIYHSETNRTERKYLKTALKSIQGFEEDLKELKFTHYPINT